MRTLDEILIIKDNLERAFFINVQSKMPGVEWSLKILYDDDKIEGHKNAHGYCRWMGGGGEVVLDLRLVAEGELVDIVDTFLHECAHALVGPDQGHNSVWKECAAFLGANTSAKSEACAKDSTDGIKPNKWLLVFREGDRLFPIISCARKLKNLESRFYSSIKNSLGNLWLIDWKKYHDMVDDYERFDSLTR